MPSFHPFLALIVLALANWGALIAHGFDDRKPSCRHANPPPIDPACVRMRDGDEIWVVSSRCIPSCSPFELDQLCCFRWNGVEWGREDRLTLIKEHQQLDDKQTVVYLHGNRTNLDWSANRGLSVFDSVFGTELARRPVRFVVWSWPADPQPRRLKEYHNNSERSVWEANVLAEFLQELGSSAPIGLFGYSFGAQSVVSAAEQACRANVDEANPPFQFRVVCLAAAYQKPWSQVEDPLAGAADCSIATLEISNSDDRALRVHYFLSRFSNDCYAGSTTVDELSPGVRHPIQFDIAELVGPKHSVVLYTANPCVAVRIREVIMGTAGKSQENPDEILK